MVDSGHGDGVVAEVAEEVGGEEVIDEGADVHVSAPPPEPSDAVVVWNGELPTVDAIRMLRDLPDGVTSRPNGIFLQTEGGEVKLGVVNAVEERYLQGACAHHAQLIAGKRPRKCQLWMRLLSGNFREAEKLLIYWLAWGYINCRDATYELPSELQCPLS